MKTVAIDNINWPVAEPGDFNTEDGGETFTVMEDENGDMYFAYGHVPETEMIAEVNRYLRHTIPGDDFEAGAGWTQHVWAKFLDHYAERFSWEGATAETPHAFPLTVVHL